MIKKYKKNPPQCATCKRIFLTTGLVNGPALLAGDGLRGNFTPIPIYCSSACATAGERGADLHWMADNGLMEPWGIKP